MEQGENSEELGRRAEKTSRTGADQTNSHQGANTLLVVSVPGSFAF